MEDKDNEYIIPFELYTILKWTGLIACPAIATFLSVVGPAWHWPYTEPLVTTVSAFGLLIGTLLGYSQINATPTMPRKKEGKDVA